MRLYEGDLMLSLHLFTVPVRCLNSQFRTGAIASTILFNSALYTRRQKSQMDSVSQ